MTVPLISVTIPAYNHEKYIEATIRSVIGQNWPRMELLVVDDGSKDGTWTVLQRLKPECEQHFERVEFVQQKNQGTCRTINRLNRLVRGEFLVGIASDDMFLPGAFRSMIQPMLEDDKIGLVVGVNELMDSEGQTCFWNGDQQCVYHEQNAKYLTFSDFVAAYNKVNLYSDQFGSYRKLLSGNHIPNGGLVRMAAYARIGELTPDAPLEDWWTHLQLSKVTKYKAVPQHTFRYRWHDANTMRDVSHIVAMGDKTFRHELRCLRKGVFADVQRWRKEFDEVRRLRRIVFDIKHVCHVLRVECVAGSRYEFYLRGHFIFAWLSKWREEA